MSLPSILRDLGLPLPLNWSAASTHYSIMPPYIQDAVSIKDEKRGIDTQAFLRYSSESGHFFSEASSYCLRGHTGVSRSGFHLTGGATFGDELYLETFNGLPAAVELSFKIDLHIKPGNNGHSFFRVSMWSPKEESENDFYFMDGKVFFSSIRQLLSLSTGGIGRIRHRHYFPFSIAVWANCWTDQTRIEWSVACCRDSFLRVYQLNDDGSKVELRSDQYSISSRSTGFPPAPISLNPENKLQKTTRS